MMDTSETYIKMCDCPEIQDLRHRDSWQEGDWVWDNRYPDIFSALGGGHDRPYKPTTTWLPRQDQLQEMYQLTTTAHLIAAFNIWLKDAPVDMYLWGAMEQLWLAFVMKEKHGKVWNGEEWDAVLETRKTPRTIPPD